MPGVPLAKEKQAVRTFIHAKLRQLSPADQASRSAIIVQKTEQCAAFRTARSILCYWPIEGEVSLVPLIEKYRHEKIILLPVVKGEELELRVFNGIENMKPGAFHIPEPDGEAFRGKVDVTLAPGIAFDNQCNRLGRGKGFYDRLLSSIQTYKIGIAYREQIIASLPVTQFDIKMDEIITD